MRILFVSDTYHPHRNGVYFFVCRLAPLLQAQGHVVAVLAPSPNGRENKRRVDGVNVYGIASWPVLRYPGVRLPKPWSRKRAVERVVASFAPDIVHLQDHFALCRDALRYCRVHGIRVLGTNHFMPENLTAWLGVARWRRVLANRLWARFARAYNAVTVVTTPTETAAALIRPLLSVEVLALSSGIDLEEFHPDQREGSLRQRYSLPTVPLLLFVGRLDPEKNIDELLEAHARVIRLKPCHLVIVGRGPRKGYLENLALDLGISHAVTFTGFVPDADLPHFYRISHCFLIASTAELLSLATLQAMASALPVVAVKAGALPELVRHEFNGFIYAPGDIDALCTAISHLLSDEPLRQEMAKHSWEISQTHDLRQTAKQFENLYRRLLGAHPSPVLN